MANDYLIEDVVKSVVNVLREDDVIKRVAESRAHATNLNLLSIGDIKFLRDVYFSNTAAVATEIKYIIDNLMNDAIDPRERLSFFTMALFDSAITGYTIAIAEQEIKPENSEPTERE